jgi:hypothetical protein
MKKIILGLIIVASTLSANQSKDICVHHQIGSTANEMMICGTQQYLIEYKDLMKDKIKKQTAVPRDITEPKILIDNK